MGAVGAAVDHILSLVFTEIETREYDRRIMPYTAQHCKDSITRALEVKSCISAIKYRQHFFIYMI